MEKYAVNHVKVEVVTPVHIGGATEKSWMQGIDFFWDKNDVYHLNLTKVLDVLSTEELDLYSTLLMSGNTSSIKAFIENKLPQLKLAGAVEPINFIGTADDQINEIKAFIKNGLGNSFLPGSSLKGAIRSHLFAYVLDQDKRLKSMAKDKGKSAEVDIFGKLGDDWMKFIQISDFPVVTTKLYKTKIYNLGKHGDEWQAKWKFELSSGKNAERFSSKGFVTAYECIAPKVSSIGRIKIRNTDELSKQLRLKTGKGLSIEKPIQSLFEWINSNTRISLERELAFFKKFSSDKQEQIENELEKLIALVPQSNTSCLMRIAAGSGFHSITGDWQYSNHLTPLTNKQIDDKKPKLYKSRKFAFEIDELNGLTLQPMGYILLTALSKEQVEAEAEKERLQLENLEKEATMKKAALQEQLELDRQQREIERLETLEKLKPIEHIGPITAKSILEGVVLEHLDGKRAVVELHLANGIRKKVEMVGYYQPEIGKTVLMKPQVAMGNVKGYTFYQFKK